MGPILGGIALAAVFFALAYLLQEEADWIGLTLLALALVCFVGGFAVSCSDPTYYFRT